MVPGDCRAVLIALTVAVVGLFGEVDSPLVYLCASLVITVVGAGIVAGHRFEMRSFELLWWAVIAWGVMAALVISGDALASKTTLASWGAAWVVWAVVARAGARERITVSIFLVSGGVVLGIAVVAGVFGTTKLITNPNISVALIVVVAPLVSGFFRSPWRARSAVALMLAPVVLTGSRAGVLAVLVVAISLWSPGRRRRWVFAIGGVGAGAAIAWRLISRPESLAWYRWRIWGAIVESIGDRPLQGIGAAGVAEAMGPYRLEHMAEVGRWGHIIGGAESMPLGLAVRVGLPALFLAVAAAVLWTLRSRRPAPATTATLGAIITMGLFHDFWSEPAVLWWWAAILGLVTLRGRESPEHRRRLFGSRRWPVALAVSGLTAWALVQPAWAQWLWWHWGPTAESVVTAVRAEPWFGEPMRWRVEDLLAKTQWTWAEASEALDWSRRRVDVQQGSAGAWSLRGRVNARIVEELGAWPATVQSARQAFERTAALEPRLPWYPYSQALMERGLGNLGEARRLVLDAVDLEPSFVRGLLLLARLELDAGHLDAARHTLDRALAVRDDGEPRACTPYHCDLLRCPDWQVEALTRELR